MITAIKFHQGKHKLNLIVHQGYHYCLHFFSSDEIPKQCIHDPIEGIFLYLFPLESWKDSQGFDQQPYYLSGLGNHAYNNSSSLGICLPSEALLTVDHPPHKFQLLPCQGLDSTLTSFRARIYEVFQASISATL